MPTDPAETDTKARTTASPNAATAGAPPRHRAKRPGPRADTTQKHAAAPGKPAYNATHAHDRPKNGERVRDRLRTEHRIIKAVGAVLAREGFWGIKINAVAREAGVDKVLIYRYFGKLDKLIAAYAKELDFWPSADEIAGYDEAGLMALPLPDRVAALIANLLRAIHRRPLTRDIIAWRLAAESELTRVLDQRRVDITQEVIDRFILPEERAAHPNLIPTIRVVTNGALYLVVGQRNNAVVSEPELTGRLDTDEGWSLLDQTVRDLMRGALQTDATQ